MKSFIKNYYYIILGVFTIFFMYIFIDMPLSVYVLLTFSITFSCAYEWAKN